MISKLKNVHPSALNRATYKKYMYTKVSVHEFIPSKNYFMTFSLFLNKINKTNMKVCKKNPRFI